VARPGLTKHRKFLRLASTLGGVAIARGHLELLWDAAYECGDSYLGDARDVELVAGWTGEPGKLVKALLECGGEATGFIELVPGRKGRYQVHDLFDHAPEYVQRRMQREAERQAKGKTVADLRSEAARKRHANGGQSPVSDQSVTGQHPTLADCQDANGATRAPAPAPAPAPTQEPPLDYDDETVVVVPPLPGGTAAAVNEEPELPPEDPEDDPPNPNPEAVPDPVANAYPWHPDDERDFGSGEKPHPRWVDYIEVHLAKRTPPPWPRFLPWLNDDIKRRAKNRAAANPVESRTAGKPHEPEAPHAPTT
jgi:hypothetical protein